MFVATEDLDAPHVMRTLAGGAKEAAPPKATK
jgi:hypothetical protein